MLWNRQLVRVREERLDDEEMSESVHESDNVRSVKLLCFSSIFDNCEIGRVLERISVASSVNENIETDTASMVSVELESVKMVNERSILS